MSDDLGAAPAPRRSGRVWLAVFVVLVFVSGAAAGALAERYLMPAWAGPRGGGHAHRHGDLAARFQRDLGLSDEQRVKVEAVLAKHAERFEALQEELRPRFAAERAALLEDMRPLLSPEQAQKLDTLMKAREREHRGRREHPAANP
jgi:Spy/CpxP family protein refolding chaperone